MNNTIKSYAKVNIGLDVVKRRSDGYHELDMIMAQVDIFDDIQLTLTEDKDIKIETNYQNIPHDERNLAYIAFLKMRNYFNFNYGAIIKISKSIPEQAGLGGGSSNAASVIKLLNKMIMLQSSEERLISIAKTIGADVPFFLVGECARVKGIGERIRVIPNRFDRKILIVKPDYGVSTKEAFANINFSTLVHPSIDDIETALISGDDHLLYDNLKNSLEVSAFKLVPKLLDLKNYLLKMGFEAVVMTGSGSALVCFSSDNELLIRAYEQLCDRVQYVFLTKLL